MAQEIDIVLKTDGIETQRGRLSDEQITRIEAAMAYNSPRDTDDKGQPTESLDSGEFVVKRTWDWLKDLDVRHRRKAAQASETMDDTIGETP